MEFTGERLVPGADGLEDLYTEHASRYLLAAACASGRRVLDAGCGCGYGTHLLALEGAEEVLGIDICPEAVEFASGRYRREGLDYRVADARDPSLEGPYGLITCFELIEHVAEDSEVIRALAGLLAADGVCLISTPNAETYVAGGEEGSNPYHCREYTRGEFENLLRTGFGGVTMLEQRWIDGMLIGPPDARGEPGISAGAAALEPDDMGAGLDAAAWGPAAYFIAACTGSPGAPLPHILTRPFVSATADRRYRRLREEFDSRGRWARKLDEELRDRDALIGRLQEEVARLEREFDERGKWAQGLDREVRDKNRLIQKLMAENENLRRAAMMTGK